MGEGNSRGISTNQVAIHDKLDELVARYQSVENRRPLSAHTVQAFESVCDWLGNWQGDIILDSCCGVGQSTSVLSNRYPDAKVIGVDKSAQRVEKHQHYASGKDNYLVVRADVNDFWRLIRQANWPLAKHYLLYPNPYPKSTQVQKRWYACPAAADLMALSATIEVRSNWQLYCEEFAHVSSHYGFKSVFTTVDTSNPLTPFEKKYSQSGQQCWQLVCTKT